MTAWRERLTAIAREHLPADAVDAWLGLLRPGVHLIAELDGAAVGQLGGDPVAVMALGGGRRNPALAEEGASWVLLAQFDSDDDVDMMWATSARSTG
ncbi:MULTISPECIES: YwqG family protein [unclassified Amycolatopsis]|uniref:YwqG family protein n=1 Tax=unclassified Amycolatopsis TaxID=2618356 RepID=UPI0021027F41|nr:YwqG family protein [Amycolatopsis sp. DSM 110486]